MKSFEEFEKETLKRMEEDSNSSHYEQLASKIFNKYEEEYINVLNHLKENKAGIKTGCFRGVLNYYDRGMIIRYRYRYDDYISKIFVNPDEEYSLYNFETPIITNILGAIHNSYLKSINQEYNDYGIPDRFRKYTKLDKQFYSNKLKRTILDILIDNPEFIFPILLGLVGIVGLCKALKVF